MTLGEKIKKYRLLRNMKQKELGEAVGFKKSTADVRINQYESNKMAPKNDIRQALAKALNVDLSAISDINISSYEDVMQVLFEFEEKLSMKIVKQNDTTCLVFDDNNKDIATLISYMNLWQNQRIAMGIDNDDVSDDSKRDYLLWKAKFKSNIDAYYNTKQSEIDNFYSDQIASLSKNVTHAVTTSEITMLVCQIIDSGIDVSTNTILYGIGDAAPGFTFTVSNLLAPPSDKAKSLIAQFLYEYQHFQELGASCFTDMQIIGKSLTVTYYVRISSFSVITSQVTNYLEYKEKEAAQGDFFRDSFEMIFKSDLKTVYNNIEDEIKRYNTSGTF